MKYDKLVKIPRDKHYNELNQHLILGSGRQSKPLRWESSALTTASFLFHLPGGLV